MQKYFEEIIEKLEEKMNHSFNQRYKAFAESIEIVNQVAEEYATIPTPHHPIPIDTQMYIAELEKKVNGDGWIPCSSGEMPKAHNEVWITYKWNDGSLHVSRDRVIHGEWHCTKREAIIAWKYMKAPAPYQPKGE